jgi:hypothetical protein
MTHYRFLTEQHDGILAEVKKGYEEQYMKVFKQVDERPIDFSGCSLPRSTELTIPVELSLSEENWMRLKEVNL